MMNGDAEIKSIICQEKIAVRSLVERSPDLKSAKQKMPEKDAAALAIGVAALQLFCINLLS